MTESAASLLRRLGWLHRKVLCRDSNGRRTALHLRRRTPETVEIEFLAVESPASPTPKRGDCAQRSARSCSTSIHPTKSKTPAVDAQAASRSPCSRPRLPAHAPPTEA